MYKKILAVYKKRLGVIIKSQTILNYVYFHFTIIKLAFIATLKISNKINTSVFLKNKNHYFT